MICGTCWFHTEIDYCATHLNCFVIARKKWRSAFHKDKSSKFRLVVFKHKLAILELNFGMTSTNRDIIDSQITFMASTKLKNLFLRCRSDDVDYSWCVFLLVKWLKNHIIPNLLFVLDQVEFMAITFNHQGICFLTYLAFECFPKETWEVYWVLSLAFDLKPVLQTFQMDATDWSRTFTTL
jgi:hypothetical protein